VQSLGTAEAMLAWNFPSSQIPVALLWHVEQSIWATVVTDTPPIVTAAVNAAA